MIPPIGLFTSSDSSENTTDRSESSADPESLRHQRRPSTITRARRSLETIAESVNTLKGFLDGPTRILDGDIVEEPREDILFEQFSPQQSLASHAPNQSDRLRRPVPRRSYDFRRTTSLSPEQSPPPSQNFTKRADSQPFSMLNQVLADHDVSEDGDAEALEHIWWTYAQEASKFDQNRISHLHKTLDVILIFSAIFSAIITPFIAESYKFLEGQPSSPAFFGPDGWTVRVNAMWFGSLILSLIAGLFSIHCKMWLDGYGVDLVFNGVANDLNNACRLRQYRYQGMQKYCIPGMIGVPPVLLYASLGFFAIGLIDFLWHLNPGIAIYVGVLCGLVLIFHVVTTSIPCFTTRSPFKTPLSHLVGNLWRGIRQRRRPKGLMELDERQDIDEHGDELDAKSLKWLIQHTQSEDVYLAALKAARAFRHQQAFGAEKPTAAENGIA